MNPRLKNILGLFGGLIAGGILNMLIITISSALIPSPEGADLTTVEGLKSSMHLLQPKHFIMPFLAHAGGTLLGAFIAAKVASTRKMTYAIIVGVFFLIGGVTNIFLLPAPLWYSIVDVVFAYLPMAYMGGKLAMKGSQPAGA